MSDTDPLLRALQSGDQRCPDGSHIAALGTVLRQATVTPASTDLLPQVVIRLNNPSDDDALVDRYYDSGRSEDLALSQLSQLIAQYSALKQPHHDLLPGILDKLKKPNASHRLPTQSGDISLDSDGKRRVWWWVAAGHLAAAMILLLIRPALREEPHHPQTPVVRAEFRPDSWSESTAATLLSPRRDEQLRQRLTDHFGLGDSRHIVPAGCRWLIDQQLSGTEDDGRFGPAIAHPEQALATQASVILALLGEGDGDTARTAAIHRGLAWLERQPRTSSHMSSALVAWAWTEAALQFRDQHLSTIAEQQLLELDPQTSGPTATIALLTLELAQAGGLTVPQRTLASSRRAIAQPLGEISDPARLGSAALTRLILGLRDRDSTRIALDRLVTGPDTTDVDPLSWLLPTLALREDGGERWNWWRIHRLEKLLVAFAEQPDRRFMVPAHRVRWAQESGGDIAATAWSIMTLQAPYRTMPLASPY